MKRNLLLFILFSIVEANSVAQTKIQLWDEENATRKMKHSEMTAYIANGNSTTPAVIICPGGSYCYLGIKNEGFRVAEWFQKQGISAFVLRYRVGIRNNRHPAMIQDLQRAIQLVKENHAKYGIDTCKVGVVGFSAGGHLAGTAATYYNVNFMEELGVEANVSLRPAFVGMIYPVVSMTDSIAHKRSRRNLLGSRYTPEEQNMMSLELNAHAGMPPVFIIHCTEDQTVDYRNSLYYKDVLKKNGVQCHFRLYDQKGHGFGIDPESDKAPSWINDFIPWLQYIHVINRPMNAQTLEK